MKLHYFQHVPYEGLDRIGDWARERAHTTSVTRFYAKDSLPLLSDIDGLIIMGGPMGVYEADQYLWMKEEMAFIRRAIESRKKVLGICLGSQLIAGALGAKVYPQAQKEIGWWPVQFKVEDVRGTALQVFAPETMLYHWHGDTFDLPPGARRLASSAACQNQAYSIDRHVLALQFHPEISAETIHRWVQESTSVQHPGGFVMSEADMKRLAAVYLPALESRLSQSLDAFFG